MPWMVEYRRSAGCFRGSKAGIPFQRQEAAVQKECEGQEVWIKTCPSVIILAERSETMEFFRSYLWQRRKGIFTFFLFCLIFLVIFLLYHLPMGAVVYPALICTCIGGILLVRDFLKEKVRIRRLRRLLDADELQNPDMVEEYYPEPETGEEVLYQEIIRMLLEKRRQREDEMNSQFGDMMDYYTVWVHQIKTPIASMRLKMQNEDTGFSRELSEDLFRIEQYVEMVLCYLRLDSDSTDYVFKEYDLDSIVKQGVKKFAGQFIRKKIRLEYEPLETKVLTDEKWLLFVLEQVLSNALKYTREGEIAITLKPGKVLCIRDTGIGIAPEDLPRIFEKGYTGYNGRSDKKASGLGLYLCRRICQKLGHEIQAESVLNKGTTIQICLNKEELEVE